MSKAFDWVETSEGRARFSGEVRGWDDYGHDTFAIDLDGHVLYGEVKAVFAGRDVSTEVVCFGYPTRDSVGIPDTATAFTPKASESIRRAILQLIEIVVARPTDREKPLTLITNESENPTGAVSFRLGWLRIDADAVEAIP